MRGDGNRVIEWGGLLTSYLVPMSSVSSSRESIVQSQCTAAGVPYFHICVGFIDRAACSASVISVLLPSGLHLQQGPPEPQGPRVLPKLPYGQVGSRKKEQVYVGLLHIVN